MRQGHFDANLDGGPEQVEIDEVQNFAVDEAAQRRPQSFLGEKACDEEEQRHTEGNGPFAEKVEVVRDLVKCGGGAVGRMFNDDQNDR